MKNLLKKSITGLTCGLLVLGVSACGNKCKSDSKETDDRTLIKYQQIDGAGVGNEDVAFVTFQFEAFDPEEYEGEQHIKYQVTYLSCKCRKADYNLSQTIYFELTVDKDVLADPTKAKVKKISYDEPVLVDDAGHEDVGGFWGDSPIFDRTTAGVNKWASTQSAEAYASEGYTRGSSKLDFYDEILPILVGTSYADIKTWGTSFKQIAKFQNAKVHRYDSTDLEYTKKDGLTENESDVTGLYEKDGSNYKLTTDQKAQTGKEYYTAAPKGTDQEVSVVDAYTNASVSINNMISVLKALFEYHASVVEKIAKDEVKVQYFE